MVSADLSYVDVSLRSARPVRTYLDQWLLAFAANPASVAAITTHSDSQSRIVELWDSDRTHCSGSLYSDYRGMVHVLPALQQGSDHDIKHRTLEEMKLAMLCAQVSWQEEQHALTLYRARWSIVIAGIIVMAAFLISWLRGH
jgi:hypothetical protein